MRLAIILFLFTIFALGRATAPSQLTIGALLPLSAPSSGTSSVAIDASLNTAFADAITEVNADATILPTTTLVGRVQDTQGDPYTGFTQWESFLYNSTSATTAPVAVVGPGGYVLAKAVEELATDSQVPLVSPLLADHSLSRNPYFLRTIPSDARQADALFALVKHYGWSKVAVVHSSDSIGTGGFLRFSALAAGTNITVLPPVRISAGADNIVFTPIRPLNPRVFVVFAPQHLFAPIMTAAKTFGVVGSSYVWLTSSSFVNRTALAASPELMDTCNGMVITHPRLDGASPVSAGYTRTQNAVRAIARGLHAMLVSNAAGTLSFTAPAAGSPMRWSTGATTGSLVSAIQSQRFNYSINPGVIGSIGFDASGEQVLTEYTIENYRMGTGFVSTGSWSPVTGMSMTTNVTWASNSTAIPPSDPQISDFVLKAVVKASRPFIYINESELTDEERFTGYTLDVWREIARRKGLKFKIETPPDDMSFNGVIAAIGEGRYDIGILDAWVTPQRLQNVSFSTAYFPDGYAMIAGPALAGFSVFTFLYPFHWSVWFMTILSVIVIAHVLWVIEVFAGGKTAEELALEFAAAGHPSVSALPYSDTDDKGGKKKPRKGTEDDGGGGPPTSTGTGPRRRRDDDWSKDGGGSTDRDHESNTPHKPVSLRRAYVKDMRQTLWFSFNSLFFSQDPARVRTVPGRFLVTIWMFCVLVLVSLYTANMAAFLTAPLARDFGTEDDLPKLKVGSRRGTGLTPYLLEKNLKSLSWYDETADMMVALKNGDIEVAVHGTANAEFLVGEDCDLEMVGQQLRLVMIALPFRPGLPFATEIDEAISAMWDDGQLMGTLRARWFGNSDCSSSRLVKPLSWRHLFGVFVMLITASIVLALTISFFRWKDRDVRRTLREQQEAAQDSMDARYNNRDSRAPAHITRGSDHHGDKRGRSPVGRDVPELSRSGDARGHRDWSEGEADHDIALSWASGEDAGHHRDGDSYHGDTSWRQDSHGDEWGGGASSSAMYDGHTFSASDHSNW